ncbi:hypothetical protein V3M63_06690 [Trueperella pyogenes]|uniref:hypothetical protein n=1 Tax=Trueperella pyogenes TaxID=1661 RepID=UPI00345D3575
MVNLKPDTTWVTDLLLVLALLTIVLATGALFTWWFAVTILKPAIDILALFLYALSGG